MRVLLDEQLPRALARHIPGHDVRTVQQERWAGLKNGELLQRAVAAGFQAFLTADQNLEYQQNLVGVPLFVVVIAAASIAIEDLLPLLPRVLEVMDSGRPGQIEKVSASGHRS